MFAPGSGRSQCYSHPDSHQTTPSSRSVRVADHVSISWLWTQVLIYSVTVLTPSPPPLPIEYSLYRHMFSAPKCVPLSAYANPCTITVEHLFRNCVQNTISANRAVSRFFGFWSLFKKQSLSLLCFLLCRSTAEAARMATSTTEGTLRPGRAHLEAEDSSEQAPATTLSGTTKGSRWTLAVRRLAIGWLSEPLTNSEAPRFIPAERAVRLLACPSAACSVSLYAVLIRLLKERGPKQKEWLSIFLDHHGLEVLFENLEAKFTGGDAHSFYSVLLQAYCVECLREVMDNQTSLEYIIENDMFIERFATGKSLLTIIPPIVFIS